MMTLDDVNVELGEVAKQLQPLLQRQTELQHEQARLESLAFIAINKVTRESIELSSGDGKPWLFDIGSFASWMKDNRCDKRFCEWNGRIYFTAEIIAGRMEPNAPGRMSELPLETKHEHA